MKTGFLIIAHAPLASALREAVLHIFSEHSAIVAAIDVRKDEATEITLAEARRALAKLATEQCLVVTDMVGGTPCNVAQKLVEGTGIPVLSGGNLPMLVRAMNYRTENLELVVQRAQEGGRNGVVRVNQPVNQTLPQPSTSQALYSGT